MSVNLRRIGLAVIACSAAALTGASGFADEPAGEPDLGAALYAEHCAVCHGERLVESGGGGIDLRKFPRNQQARFMNSVLNGKNNMPPWRSLLSAAEVEALFKYVNAGEGNAPEGSTP